MEGKGAWEARSLIYSTPHPPARADLKMSHSQCFHSCPPEPTPIPSLEFGAGISSGNSGNSHTHDPVPKGAQAQSQSPSHKVTYPVPLTHKITSLPHTKAHTLTHFVLFHTDEHMLTPPVSLTQSPCTLCNLHLQGWRCGESHTSSEPLWAPGPKGLPRSLVVSQNPWNLLPLLLIALFPDLSSCPG